MGDDTVKERAAQHPPSGRIIFLDSYRALAIVMVVGVHTLGYCHPLPDFQKQIISFVIHAIAVPIFFLVDGYLFAQSTTLSQTYNYLDKVRKSAFRLLLPWAIFTIFYTIARYYFEKTGFLESHTIVGHPLSEIMISAYGSAIAPQMYFLFSLFLLRLLNPLFRKIVLSNSYGLVITIFICYNIVYRSSIGLLSPFLHIEGGQEPILHALWGLQYYLLGIILYRTSLLLNLRKLFLPLSIVFAATVLFRDELGMFKFSVQYLYLISSFLLFELAGNKLSFLEKLGKKTMGIYLIHAPIVLKGVSIVANKFITVPLWSFFSVLSGTLLLSYCIVVAINHIPYGTVLFGVPYHRKVSLSYN